MCTCIYLNACISTQPHSSCQRAVARHPADPRPFLFPLENQNPQGARTLGLSIPAYLGTLKSAGLGSLPGTAAEVLDDAVRAVLCPDKLSTGEWLGVVRAAHGVGLMTTSTLMFGHVEEGPGAWGRHLLALRKLAAETGG